jgi:hypothetical protein
MNPVSLAHGAGPAAAKFSIGGMNNGGTAYVNSYKGVIQGVAVFNTVISGSTIATWSHDGGFS